MKPTAVSSWAAQQQGAQLTPYSFTVEQLQPAECLIKVTHCGICHSDVHMIDNDWGMSTFPIVPGHEVEGEVLEVGSEVKHLRQGQRVGVGWQRSACLQCEQCLEGNENLCDENRPLIATGPGGFADHLVVDAAFAFPLPDGLERGIAGPLLCGGITVYAALHHAGMTAGGQIGVIGVGGLGHMAVKFAAALGNQVTVYTTSEDKAEYAASLGASRAVLVPPGQPLPPPRRKLDVLLNTAPVSLDWAAYLEHLAPDGTLSLVAVPPEPLTVPVASLLFKRKRIMASPIGGRAIITRMLQVAADHGVSPQVETFPLARVNDAIQKVRDNTVRYRAVLEV